MYSKESESKKIVLPWYLLIFDDIMGDKEMSTRFKSDLSNLSTYSRHYNLDIIILKQDYTLINHTIWWQCPVTVLCSSDNYTDAVIKENSIKGYEKKLQELYQDIILQKNYWCILIQKDEKIDKRTVVLSPDGIEYVDITKE